MCNACKKVHPVPALQRRIERLRRQGLENDFDDNLIVTIQQGDTLPIPWPGQIFLLNGWGLVQAIDFETWTSFGHPYNNDYEYMHGVIDTTFVGETLTTGGGQPVYSLDTLWPYGVPVGPGGSLLYVLTGKVTWTISITNNAPYLIQAQLGPGAGSDSESADVWRWQVEPGQTLEVEMTEYVTGASSNVHTSYLGLLKCDRDGTVNSPDREVFMGLGVPDRTFHNVDTGLVTVSLTAAKIQPAGYIMTAGDA